MAHQTHKQDFAMFIYTKLSVLHGDVSSVMYAIVECNYNSHNWLIPILFHFKSVCELQRVVIKLKYSFIEPPLVSQKCLPLE
jgi:hypothetical protein